MTETIAPQPIEMEPADQKEFDDYTAVGTWEEPNEEE